MKSYDDSSTYGNYSTIKKFNYFKCMYCDNIYKYSRNLSRHLNSCKGKLEIQQKYDELLIKNKKLEDEKKELNRKYLMVNIKYGN